MEGNKVLMPTEDPFIVLLGKNLSNSSNSNFQKVEIFTTEITESESGPSKLNPLMVVDLPRSLYSAVLGSSTVRRDFPHTIVHDSKLYILGGLNYPFSVEHWMEVFDPISEKWTSLPNPPVEIIPHYMVTALRKSQNQIIVSTYLAFPVIQSECLRFDPTNCMFFTYDIRSGFWANLDLDPPVRRLLGGGRSASANGAPLVDDALYWVKLDNGENSIDLIVDSYNLCNDQWFEGRLNIYQEIFGKREYLSSQSCSYPRLIHIGDDKFFLNLQSYPQSSTRNDKRRMHFVYNVVLSIFPLSDSEEEVTDSEEEVMAFEQKAFLLPDLKKKLSVSVHSIKKYKMDHDIEILDALLWKQ